MPFARWFNFCGGAATTVQPYVSTVRGALVRIRHRNPQGEPLPSLRKAMTADEAEALGTALIAAAAVARLEHAASLRREGRTA